MRKSICVILTATMLLLVSCGEQKMNFNTELVSDYNESMFYVNKNNLELADPDAIYITEGKEKGYIYIYATSDAINNTGVQCWRTKNLVDFECMGTAFIPNRDSWGLTQYWAPEVIYIPSADGSKGLYWMYYCASNRFKTNLDSSGNGKTVGAAYSQNPYGPFIQWTGTNADGRSIGIENCIVDMALSSEGDMAVVDPSPFLDGNDLYLYFTHDTASGSSVYGIKMKDPITPDYSSLVQLTKIGYSAINSETRDQTWENNINEGPNIIKHNGRYYLSYSSNYWTDRMYSVGLASSDKPLGPFVKIPVSEGNPILGIDGYFDHISGTGHNSFLTMGDELFIVYHEHTDRYYGGKQRAFAIDKCSFRYSDSLGYDVIACNGPTYSVQPLPAAVSGYSNIAGNASITVKGANIETIRCLTDNLIKIRELSPINEFMADGYTEITLDFDKYVNVRSVMVYNSSDYNLAFEKIDNIYLYTLDGTKIISDINFDKEKYVNDEEKFMRPGGAAIALFDDISVNKMILKFKSKKAFAITELCVLGGR